MSGIPVPLRSTPAALRSLRVGQPVSALHAQRWSGEAIFQLAALGVPIGDCTINANAVSNASQDISFAYARSPGAMAVIALVEWNNVLPGWFAGNSATATLTRSGGTMSFITPGGLDGASAVTLPGPHLRDPGRTMAVLDVSSLAANGTIEDFNLNVSPVGAIYLGVRRFHLVEVPLADVAPDSDPAHEQGVTPGFAMANARMVDGSIASGSGFVRGTDAWMDAPRYRRRLHVQWATTTSAPAQTSSTTFADFDWCPTHTYWSSTLVPTWRMRSRRLYIGAVPNNYTFRVVYSCAAASGGTVRLVINSTNWNLTVPSSSGWAVTAVNVTVPNTTTNQESTLRVLGLTTDATKPLQIRNWALIENES